MSLIIDDGASSLPVAAYVRLLPAPPNTQDPPTATKNGAGSMAAIIPPRLINTPAAKYPTDSTQPPPAAFRAPLKLIALGGSVIISKLAFNEATGGDMTVPFIATTLSIGIKAGVDFFITAGTP